MNQLRKYRSVQALKASLKPLQPASTGAGERHHQFARFIHFLKDEPARTSGPATNQALPSPGADEA